MSGVLGTLMPPVGTEGGYGKGGLYESPGVLIVVLIPVVGLDGVLGLTSYAILDSGLLIPTGEVGD